jgi:hypothetical protein
MPQAKLSPKYFFLSFGVLATLIASVVSFLNLVFETLNRKFPDVLSSSYEYGYHTYDFEGMRSALATLIIIFPVFLIVSYFWCRQAERGLGDIDGIIRRWVIYLVLFLSTVVIVADLVTLVKYFVAGEITLRFILKVLIALLVAVLVGSYYILELRRGKNLFKTSIIFALTGGVLVLAAIIFSFMIMGSPAKQRQLRLDDRRVNDLQNIQWQVINYFQQKEKLPASLNDLKDPLSGFSLPIDPEFEKGNKYEYAVKDKLKFELCATFALPIPKGWREYGDGGRPIPLFEKDMVTSYPYPGPGGTNESWDHGAGRTCFEREIDPERYPPFKKLNQ